MSGSTAVGSTTEQLRSVMQRLERAMNERQLDQLDELLTDDFVRHSEATPQLQVQSREQFKEFLRQDAASFPDNVQRFIHVAVEGDLIGFYASYEGTHEGPLGPFPATGKRVKFHFAGVFRAEGGKLAESWLTWDNVTILGQLGLLPDAPS